MKRYHRILIVLGSCVVAACGSSTLTGPRQLDGITRVVLRAWEDTRRDLPPLAVTRADSIAMFVNFVGARRDGWQNASGELPGRPLFAELERGTAVVSRFGFIELVHGGAGYFITTDGGKNQLRPASAAELAAFLAFFGIGVQIIPD